jgi:hypothetical protein
MGHQPRPPCRRFPRGVPPAALLASLASRSGAGAGRPSHRSCRRDDADAGPTARGSARADRERRERAPRGQEAQVAGEQAELGRTGALAGPNYIFFFRWTAIFFGTQQFFSELATASKVRNMTKMFENIF